MKARTAILELLERWPEMSSGAIKAALRVKGFWFADVRASWALAYLLEEGVLERRWAPGGRDRGYRPKAYYRKAIPDHG